MAARGGNIVVRFTYTGAGGERIPDNATHVFVDAKIIPVRAFRRHPNIIEVICHDRVEKIEEWAFCGCPSLRRVIMPGVKVVEHGAFYKCEALEDVECDKLEIVEGRAFYDCTSLRIINLPSAEIVGRGAFANCEAMADVKFGNKLERFDQGAFLHCASLERITVPLKGDMIPHDNIFSGCTNLKHVDLVERTELRETIAALYMEGWRNDMQEIDSINQILPNARAGDIYRDVGEKANVMRRWLRSALDKILHYKREHQCILDEAVTTLQLALPRDIVMNNVLSFLTLPPHRFGVEDHEDDGEENVDQEQDDLYCVIL